MRSGVEGTWKRAAGLAHTNAAHSTRDDNDAQGQQNWSPSEQCQSDRRAPMDFGGRRHGSGTGRERLAILQLEIKIANRSRPDRKSTRLNSSHVEISYAVFCLKKKNKKQ